MYGIEHALAEANTRTVVAELLQDIRTIWNRDLYVNIYYLKGWIRVL